MSVRNSLMNKRIRRFERLTRDPQPGPVHPSGLNGKTRRTLAKLFSREAATPGFNPADRTDPVALAIFKQHREAQKARSAA